MQSKRKIHLEFMRIVACYFVIYQHTYSNGFLLYTQRDPHTPAFWVYLLISTFSSFSTPLFLAISGCLLLKKTDEPISVVYRHRVLRFFLVLLFWSLICFHFESISEGTPETASIFISRFFGSSWNFTYWYLYAFLGMLITLPLLRRLAVSLTNREYVYLFGLFYSLSSLLLIVQYRLWQGSYQLNPLFFPSWVTGTIFFYPLIGFFLEERLSRFWTPRKLIAIWIWDGVALLVAAYMNYYKGTLEGKFGYSFNDTAVCVTTVCIFATSQYWFSRHSIPPLMEKLLCSMGSCTLGVYILHIIVKDYLHFGDYLTGFLHGRLHWNMMLTQLLCSGAVFIICYILTLLLKKIPMVRKLV